MARRATIIKSIKEERSHVLVIDGGDFLPSAGKGAPERTALFLTKVYESFGPMIIGVGEYDLNFGVRFLEEKAKEHGLRPISANLVRKKNEKPVFRPYVVEKADWAKVAVVSVLGDDIRLNLPEEERDEYEVTDPVEAAKKAVAEARKDADAVVLLAHMNRISAQKVAAGAGDVDVMIIGHSPGPFTTKTPLELAGVPSYQIANQGRYLGQLELNLRKDGAVSTDVLVIHTLDDNVAYDEEMMAWVTEYKDREAEFNKEALAAREIAPATGGAGHSEEYIGTGMCARCHADAYAAYAHSAHSQAYFTLVEREKSRTEECVSCHVTGFGEQGGFELAAQRSFAIDLTSVQCEACHDRGTLHKRDGTYLEGARDSCTKCHTEEQSPGFDYAEYWEKIKH